MGETMEREELMGKNLGAELLAAIYRSAAPLIQRPWAEVQQEIMENTGAIIKENAGRAIDKPSEILLLPTSAFTLAVYRVLSKMIDDKEQVVEILAAAVGDQIGKDIEAYVSRRFGVTQEAPELAFELSRVNFKKIGEEQLGRAFVYEQEGSGDAEFSTNVRKCFFWEFFSENKASELLLPVICMQDDLWMKELNKPKYKMKVSRSSILAQGSDACRFNFSRKE